MVEGVRGAGGGFALIGGFTGRTTVDGFRLTDFAVVSSPSLEHPRGVIGALAFAVPPTADTPTSLITMDLDGDRVLARNLLGYYTAASRFMIDRARRGIVVARQDELGLKLSWFNDGTLPAGERSVASIPMKENQELRGLATYDDRIVLATGGTVTTTMWILDEKGTLLTSHRCHGGLSPMSGPGLVRTGDDVIVSDFLPEGEHTPVCRGRLHGPPRWRDENLQPTGLPRPATAEVTPCKGLTGAYRRHTEELAGQWIVSTGSCCGDEDRGGLFVCKPPSHGP
jgi:hypothetical protein